MIGGFVMLVDVMGDDNRVAEAARVSYRGGKVLRDNKGLLNYLMEHQHMTPFEHCTMTFHIRCPKFISIQWMRHRAGSFNEISQRYTEVKEDFWMPDGLRQQGTVNKQGSNGALELNASIRGVNAMDHLFSAAYKVYQDLLGMGVAREQARAVLPTAAYTEFYWTVNLRMVLHFLGLRAEEHAQEEMQWYAYQVLEAVKAHFPLTYNAWYTNVRSAITLTFDTQDLIQRLLDRLSEGDIQDVLDDYPYPITKKMESELTWTTLGPSLESFRTKTSQPMSPLSESQISS